MLVMYGKAYWTQTSLSRQPTGMQAPQWR